VGEYVRALDRQIVAIYHKMPWFFFLNAWDSGILSVQGQSGLIWQYYMVHSTICIQRIRLLRPFLDSNPEAHASSVQVANEILDSYKFIRQQPSLRRNPKFQITAYQSYSAAVQLAAFLLVERSAPETLRQDIEIVIEDLGANTLGLPISVDGCTVLRHMLQLYDHLGATSVSPESIAQDIAPVFGGERSARNYLRRCNIDNLLNRDRAGTADGSSSRNANPAIELIDMFNFDAPLDMLGVEDWTTLLQDMNVTS
jgi:hypothetical protein